MGREAILGLTAEISQISGVPGLGGFANLFLYLGGIRKIECQFFLYFQWNLGPGQLESLVSHRTGISELGQFGWWTVGTCEYEQMPNVYQE